MRQAGRKWRGEPNHRRRQEVGNDGAKSRVRPRPKNQAQKIIRKGFYQTKNVEYKGQVDLVTETDKVCEDLILNHLRKHYPDHKFIGEEISAALGVTAELTDNPSVSLTHSTAPPNPSMSKICTVGVMYNPIMNELFTAVRGKGAFLNVNSNQNIMSRRVGEGPFGNRAVPNVISGPKKLN